jgi:predicted unusual protein kinase regulating ubiquinone biosynthesis (AarF/ABC1/UbiB family)
MGDGSDPRIKRIKTGKLERRISLASAGMIAGTRAATQLWTNWWLPKADREQRQKQILAEAAQYLADELGKLKGSVVKVGQIMAAYGEHVLPAEVTLALRSLEENTIAVEWDVMHGVLVAELGADLVARLEIEPDPAGAASLAQVHRATRKSDGAQLALKIQYPGVLEAIDADLDDVAQLLRLTRLVNAGHGFDEWLEEMRRLLHHEVNYVQEALTIERFSARLAGDAIVRVPRLYPDYCSARALAMSFEAGLPINAPEVGALPQSRRDALAQRYLQLFFQELFDWGELQTDPNFGNYRIRSSGQGDELVLLDFGAVMRFDASFLASFRNMVRAAWRRDRESLLRGAYALQMVQPDHPEKVQDDFAELCMMLVEPLNYVASDVPPEAVTVDGKYAWGRSQLPRRAAKFATKSAFSLDFSLPPKEFAFISRKMLGVYNVIAGLDAEFAPPSWLVHYLQTAYE